jgi:DNA-binding transcriptional MerR regulator
VPASIHIPDKMFFKIGEVSELTGIKSHVLRYWESEFSLIRPQKSNIGQRVYRRRDVEIVLRIKQLLYEDRYTIEGAKKKISQELKPKKTQQHSSTQKPKLEEIIKQQKQELRRLINILEK